MAWISPPHAGAIVSFETRPTTESPWTSRHQASADPATALTLVANGDTIWNSRTDWMLHRRDPTSATVINSDSSIEIIEVCELGELRIIVSASQKVLSTIDPVATDPDRISFHIDRSDNTLEIRLFSAEEDAEATQSQLSS